MLQSALDDAQAQNKNGLVTVAGASKFHFMSDTKWLMRQGFEVVAKLPSGFVLLVKKLKPEAKHPTFKEQVLSEECPDKDGWLFIIPIVVRIWIIMSGKFYLKRQRSGGCL